MMPFCHVGMGMGRAVGDCVELVVCEPAPAKRVVAVSTVVDPGS